jgi:hypothetical protein
MSEGPIADAVECECGGKIRIEMIDGRKGPRGEQVGTIESGRCIECGRHGKHYDNPNDPDHFEGCFVERVVR